MTLLNPDYPNIKTNFPMVVACLDSESMALGHNAVVTEVALVTAELKLHDTAGVMVNPESVTKYVMYFNVLDQIARGRVFNTDTYLFHMRSGGLKGISDQVAPGLTVGESETCDSLKRIQEITSQCAEIWINGLSFDPGLLQSLCRSYNYDSGKHLNSLWDYSKERDTRTIYRTFPLVKDSKKSDHRALTDALWCLDMATQYHQGVEKYLRLLRKEMLDAELGE